MKLNQTILAATLALAVAGPASAAVVDMSTGSSNLVLSIWDTTTSTTYVRDLGINMSSFMAGVTGTSAATVVANASGFSTAPIAADTTFTNWLANSTGLVGGAAVNLATTSWSITAGDNVGLATGFGLQNFLTTSNAAKPTVSTLNLTNGGLSAQTSFNAWNTITTNAGGSSAVVQGPLAISGGPHTNWANKWTFGTSAAIGTSMNFLYMTPGATNVAAASVAKFNGGVGGTNSTWTLASNGTLSFANGAPVAAVPEPGEWALMLSGFGLIGFIATRRRNSKNNMIVA